MARKPRLAVFKFASCDGCQLSLLDAEDELLAICDKVEIAHFAEASSDLQPGPYDVALVEGSITDRSRRGSHPSSSPRVTLSDHDWGLRHVRWDSSVKKLGADWGMGWCGVSEPGIHSNPRHIDADCRSRSR